MALHTSVAAADEAGGRTKEMWSRASEYNTYVLEDAIPMSLVKRFRLALQLLGEDASTFYFCDYKIISLGPRGYEGVP